MIDSGSVGGMVIMFCSDIDGDVRDSVGCGEEELHCGRRGGCRDGLWWS